MMTSRLILPVMLMAALAGCSDPMKTGRYLIEAPQTGREVTNRIGTAELLDVSLPEYARADEVAWQTADGAVRATSRQLWADDPQRAFTLTLARAISDISGATVIAEPWPLTEPPRHKLDVRVERALAGANGVYRLAGRYFLSDDRASGANLARGFDIRVPIAGEGPGAIAEAQAQALGALARQIAQLGGPGSSVANTAPAAQPLIDPFSLPPLEGF